MTGRRERATTHGGRWAAPRRASGAKRRRYPRTASEDFDVRRFARLSRGIWRFGEAAERAAASMRPLTLAYERAAAATREYSAAVARDDAARAALKQRKEA